jgi:hypothetical protein
LENARLQAQDNLAVAQGNVALSLINVYRALGGGWEIRYEKEEMAKGLELPLEAAPSGKSPEPLQAPKLEPPAKKSEDQQQKLEEKSP